MPARIDWDARIGRRLRLRDLHIFFAVVQARSMAKAATQLRVTQPSVSKAISELEGALGVRLFDRSPQGVEPTMYGQALLTCGAAVFDELKQGIRNLEFLADPTVGELRIGCMESLSATLVGPLMLRFAEQHPRVTVHIDDLTPPALDFSGLRERRYDCALVRLNPPHSEGCAMDDLNVERLFDDRLVIAAGGHGRWSRRRKIDLGELSDEPWIFTPPGTWGNECLAQAFRARGLKVPNPSLMSLSIVLRARLLRAGAYLTVFANSVMRLNADRYGLVVLPIDLPNKPWPVVVVSLKHRTLSPLVGRFIACAREVAQTVADTSRTRKSGGHLT
jgi:DNA-binding transcriptional LysR family regulator